jgi:tight adherence protein B
MDILIVIAMFITTVLLIEGGYFAIATISNPEHKRVRRRLQTLSRRHQESQGIDVVRHRPLSDVVWIHNLLVKIPPMQDLGRLLEQANSRYNVGTFLWLSVVLFCLGLLFAPLVMHNPTLSLLVAACLGLTPLFYVVRKRKQRMRKFEAQLPEALDLVARAMKAGHTFVVGMKMVSDQFSDPVGVEFDKIVDEITFGVSVSEALAALLERVTCPDARFFVTSVIVQRETGGNLAEILEQTSHLIRQRFELFGRIRVLTADGRLSAIILVALPFFVGFALYVISPDYFLLLFTDPIGKAALVYASVMMVMGILVMKKMINIRV